MRKFILLLSCFCATTTFAQLQQTQPTKTHDDQCITDQRHRWMLVNDQEYAQVFALNQEKLRDYIANNVGQPEAATVLTIPVVVHVMHLGEAVGVGTNISTAQIQSAIDNLNDAYGGVGSYPIDTDIEFALAVRNPTCGSTTGINRVDASGTSDYSTNGLTTSGSDNEETIKALSKWPNGDYYNIWIVSEINGNNGGAGTQGFAYFASAHSSPTDGAVILYNSFGYDPTGALGYNLKSYTNHNATAIHELGHAFDLYHTFEGDDANDDDIPDQCPSNTTCASQGDKVCDTDPHRRDDGDCLDVSGTTCAGGNIFPVVDNFMAYSSDECQTDFTSGQSTRMRAAIQTNRSTLLDSPALTTVTATQPAIAQTCQPQTTDLTNGFKMGVYRLSIGGTSYGSSSSRAESGYRENWCSNFTLDISTMYSVQVDNHPTLNPEDVEVYIDYNNDGDFADVGENIFSGTGAQTHSGNFNTPASPTTGTPIWVRVISDFAGNNISGPCYAPQYGQVEDFSVTIQAAGSAPVAEFTANQTSLCEGGSVNFTDQSTNTPTSWSWTFNGGTPSTSTAQNPSGIVFNSAGTYTIELTATNASGNDTETKTNYITVNANPTTTSSTTDETCTGNDGTATANPSGGQGPYTYLWDPSAGSQTTQTANGLAAGSYNFTVSDANLCSVNSNETVSDGCVGGPTNLKPAFCGVTLSSIDQLISCVKITGGTNYRFRVTDQSTSQQYFYTKGNQHTTFRMSWIPQVVYNQGYDVDVAVYMGSWSAYGSVCSVTTPAAFPTSQLKSQFCNGAINNVNTLISCDPVTGATNWEWEFTDQATSQVYTRIKGNKYTSLWPWDVTGVANGNTYDVRVRPYVGVWGNYGTTCSLTINSLRISNPADNDGKELASSEGSLESVSLLVDEVKLKVKPNPVSQYQSIDLSLSGIANQPSEMLLNVTDIYGKTIIHKDIPYKDGGILYRLNNSGSMAKGIYLVVLYVDGIPLHQRVVIQ